MGFLVADTTIDLNTGLPSSGRDVSGLQTDYEFDSLGRFTWVKPATGHDVTKRNQWSQHLCFHEFASSCPAYATRGTGIRQAVDRRCGTV